MELAHHCSLHARLPPLANARHDICLADVIKFVYPRSNMFTITLRGVPLTDMLIRI